MRKLIGLFIIFGVLSLALAGPVMALGIGNTYCGGDGGDATIEQGAIKNVNKNTNVNANFNSNKNVNNNRNINVNSNKNINVNRNSNRQNQNQGQAQGQLQGQLQVQKQSANNEGVDQTIIQNYSADKRDHIQGPGVLNSDSKLTNNKEDRIKIFGIDLLNRIRILSAAQAKKLSSEASNEMRPSLVFALYFDKALLSKYEVKTNIVGYAVK